MSWLPAIVINSSLEVRHINAMAKWLVQELVETNNKKHYIDVTMSTMASQITSLTIVYPTVYSGVDQRKHQSYASLTFVRGIHRWPVSSPHKGPVTRKIIPFDDVILPYHDVFMPHSPIGH